jgi:hypothetical protein
MTAVRRLGTVAFVLAIQSCGGGGSSTPPPAGLMSLAVTPSASTVQLINANQQFKAVGTFSDGTSKDLTASVTWSTSDLTVMRVINDPALNGLGTPISPGIATVSATSGSVVGSTQVTVATDGLSDWAVRQFSGGGYAGLAYSGSRYVDLTMQMTSTDGTTWHPLQGGRSIAQNYQYGLVWNGSDFVAWGNTSSDGLHWTPHDVSSISAHASIQRIAWSGTQLVAISSDQYYQILNPLSVNLLFSSPDGVNWTQHLGPYQSPDLSGITWTGSQFYVVGQGGIFLSSPDGAAWTGMNPAGPITMQAVAASPARLVAVGGTTTTGTVGAPIQASQDGITWNAVSPPAWTGVDFFWDVIWNGSQFVAVGGTTPYPTILTAGLAATSPDGLTWTLHSSPQYMEHVIWSGSQFVAEGPSVIQTSPDGVNWTSATSATPGGDTAVEVVWSGSKFTAVTAGNTIIESPDGISWTTAYSAPGALNCIAWSGTIYVACTSNGFLTSPDGTTWTFRPDIAISTANAVLWTGSKFVAVAGNTVLTSPDGISWTAPLVPTPSTTLLDSIAWSGSRYVAAGPEGLVISADAVTWTSAGVSAFWVAWNGKQFVAVAADNASPSNVYTSADGTTWTKHAVPFTFEGGGLIPNLTPLSIIWTGSQFLAQGCSATSSAAPVCDVFSSADGVVWTVSLSMTYPYFQLMGAASNASRTVMMGRPMILSLP